MTFRQTIGSIAMAGLVLAGANSRAGSADRVVLGEYFTNLY